MKIEVKGLTKLSELAQVSTPPPNNVHRDRTSLHRIHRDNWDKLGQLLRSYSCSYSIVSYPLAFGLPATVPCNALGSWGSLG